MRKPGWFLLPICVVAVAVFLWRVGFQNLAREEKNYAVLVITNYSYETNKPRGYDLKKLNRKAHESIEEIIEKQLGNVEIVWIDYPEKARNRGGTQTEDKKEFDRFRKKLKALIEKYRSKLILVVDGSISKTAQDTLDLIPSEIPVWTEAVSKDANSKYGGTEIYSTASAPRYSKAYSILRVVGLLNLKGIVFVLSDSKKESPYS